MKGKRKGALSYPNLLVILSDHFTWENMEPVLSNRYPVSRDNHARSLEPAVRVLYVRTCL
jgi:hypothetical protein